MKLSLEVGMNLGNLESEYDKIWELTRYLHVIFTVVFIMGKLDSCWMDQVLDLTIFHSLVESKNLETKLNLIRLTR